LLKVDLTLENRVDLDPPKRLSIALRPAMSLALAGISPYE
jgi:hypothetical protein